jgi:hypothetical protein
LRPNVLPYTWSMSELAGMSKCLPVSRILYPASTTRNANFNEAEDQLPFFFIAFDFRHLRASDLGFSTATARATFEGDITLGLKEYGGTSGSPGFG